MKKPTFNEEQRGIVARRIRNNRKALRLSQAEVAHRSGYDATVVKHIENGVPASAAAYECIAQTVGLTFEELLQFTSMTEEIQDLIASLEDDGFTSQGSDAFIAQFYPETMDSYSALHTMGLKISGGEFSLFDVLVKYKGRVDLEFANYLKDMGLEKEQRLYIHSFAVLYYVFNALENYERVNMQSILNTMMERVQNLILWEETRNNPNAARICPVTGDIIYINGRPDGVKTDDQI